MSSPFAFFLHVFFFTSSKSVDLNTMHCAAPSFSLPSIKKDDMIEKYYAWMRVMPNETAEDKEICFPRRRSGDNKNRFEEMKSTRRECTLYIMESRWQQNRDERD